MTLHALKDELAARGVKVSHNAVWLFLRREGLRFKERCSLLNRAVPPAPPLAIVAGQPRSATPGLYR
nr:hypothetical protein [Bradyrhizobium sp. sGM-13]